MNLAGDVVRMMGSKRFCGAERRFTVPSPMACEGDERRDSHSAGRCSPSGLSDRSDATALFRHRIGDAGSVMRCRFRMRYRFCLCVSEA